MIVASIRHNLANLLRFSGRESRGLFWPYAIFVFLLAIVADILLFIPVMNDMMTRAMDYARTHPGGIPQAAPGQPPVLPPELMPDMSGIIVPMLIVNLVGILLLAAAAVRRLHDCDRTGLWAALPLPFRLIGAAIGPAAAKAMTKAMAASPAATLAAGDGEHPQRRSVAAGADRPRRPARRGRERRPEPLRRSGSAGLDTPRTRSRLANVGSPASLFFASGFA